MSKKIKIIIVAGGTGGHVFPGINLAKHLINKSFYEVNLITDKRGQRYLNNSQNIQTSILPSSPFKTKNLLVKLFSIIHIIYSILRSLIHLILKKPSIIFGMGGYASFPICIAASLLRINFVIYENNLVVGKANKYLLPFTKKILISNDELEGIPSKFQNKIYKIGNIIKTEILNSSNLKKKIVDDKKLNLLILGGSQAAKAFAELLPHIFKKCYDQGIKLKIYQHCLTSQNDNLKRFYKKNNIESEIFNFSYNLEKYFLQTNLAITRSGSSMLAELTNAKLPFISVPLPSSADDHQLKNALYYQRKKLAMMIEEKELDSKLANVIRDIYMNRSILDEILQNQRQFSDKNVYKNIDHALEEMIDEKY